MFRVGILYRIQQFLELVDRTPITAPGFQASFPRYDQVRSEDILRIALTCSWVSLDPHMTLKITPRGGAVVEEEDPKLKLRMQLKDILQSAGPPWSGLLNRGRWSVLRYGNPDVVQCFRDAGLLDENDRQTCSWWDEVAASLNAAEDLHRLKIGRKGEWLSMEHEKSRVGQTPEWIALDNSAAGYDLLSRVDSSCCQNLIIEVKTSEEPQERASFYLTRHEWSVLSSHRHSVLHLWSVKPNPPILRVLSVETLRAHVPADAGSGKWQVARIPFLIADNESASS